MKMAQPFILGPGSAPRNVRVLNIDEDYVTLGWEYPEITNGEIEVNFVIVVCIFVTILFRLGIRNSIYHR